jgi:hypothetical protein
MQRGTRDIAFGGPDQGEWRFDRRPHNQDLNLAAIALQPEVA